MNSSAATLPDRTLKLFTNCAVVSLSSVEPLRHGRRWPSRGWRRWACHITFTNAICSMRLSVLLCVPQEVGWATSGSCVWFNRNSANLINCQVLHIDLFQEGVAIILRVTRDDSWLAKAISNAYSRLTLGCLVSIVCDFFTYQWFVVPTSVPSALLMEETRDFLVPSLPGGCTCGCWRLAGGTRIQTNTPDYAANIS